MVSSGEIRDNSDRLSSILKERFEIWSSPGGMITLPCIFCSTTVSSHSRPVWRSIWLTRPVSCFVGGIPNVERIFSGVAWYRRNRSQSWWKYRAIRDGLRLYWIINHRNIRILYGFADECINIATWNRAINVWSEFAGHAYASILRIFTGVQRVVFGHETNRQWKNLPWIPIIPYSLSSG